MSATIGNSPGSTEWIQTLRGRMRGVPARCAGRNPRATRFVACCRRDLIRKRMQPGPEVTRLMQSLCSIAPTVCFLPVARTTPRLIWLFRPETDLDAYAASIRRLAALAPQVRVVHGRPQYSRRITHRTSTTGRRVRGGASRENPAVARLARKSAL